MKQQNNRICRFFACCAMVLLLFVAACGASIPKEATDYADAKGVPCVTVDDYFKEKDKYKESGVVVYGTIEDVSITDYAVGSKEWQDLYDSFFDNPTSVTDSPAYESYVHELIDDKSDVMMRIGIHYIHYMTAIDNDRKYDLQEGDQVALYIEWDTFDENVVDFKIIKKADNIETSATGKTTEQGGNTSTVAPSKQTTSGTVESTSAAPASNALP